MLIIIIFVIIVIIIIIIIIKLSFRRKKQKALIMYKTLNELALDYLQCLFTQQHVNDYYLRKLEGKLPLPKPNNYYLKRSFPCSGDCLWNNLPQHIKSVGSIGKFKRGIKKVSEISDSHVHGNHVEQL